MKAVTATLNTEIAGLLQRITADRQAIDSGAAGPGQREVQQSWKAVTDWDEWFQANRTDMDQLEQTLHEMTIRWAKGIVKEWRVSLAKQRSLT